MKKILEGTQTDTELEIKLDNTLQGLESWVNHSPNLDFHSIDLFKAGQLYYLIVDFGLTKTIWRITRSELHQLRNKGNIEEVAGFVERMSNEPIKDRG